MKSKPLNEFYLGMSARERDTIIAALRFWQASYMGGNPDLNEIADNDREGDDARLSSDEIDALIEERINV